MLVNPFATRTVFVLGAGFSKPAGLPLGTELWQEVLSLARKTNYYDPLEREIRKYLDFMSSVEGCQFTESEIDLEEFVSYLDTVSLLGLGNLEPPHPPDRAPNITRTLQLIRFLVAQTLFDHQSAAKDDNLDLYKEFVNRLNPADIVITFNYDTLLECTLDDLDKDYNLVRIGRTSFYPITNDPIHGDYISVLKMHGSIDWFQELPQTEPGRSDYNDANIYPVSVGRRFGAHRLRILGETSDDTLSRILRVPDMGSYFAKGVMSMDVPFVVAPSHQKLIYVSPLLGFWRAFTETDFVKRVVIIGYSLPSFDQYARIALYQLVSRQEVTLVDLKQPASEQDSYKQTYRFVDWDRAKSYFHGFDMKALDIIFPD